MKKLFSIMVAIAMCACLCLPAFAAEDAGLLDKVSDSLGGLDMENFDMSGLEDALGNIGTDLEETDILGTVTGLLGGLGETGGDTGSAEAEGALDSVTGMLGDFDATGALTEFTAGLDASSLTSLFSGLTDSLSGAGIDLSSFSFGSFDIASLLEGNSGSGAGMASIMDGFSGVLETLGLDSSVIEGLLDNDIVNFFANLYLGAVGPVEETTTEAPTTTEPTTVPEIPQTGDTSTVMVAIATLSVASAAAFVCTKKKRD